MPKAVSNTFVRPHAASQRPQKPKTGGDGNAEASSSGARNHLFNTERFGQHILTNPLVAQGIVDKANLKPTDVVLEVGPGTGNLTVRILAASRKCVAVEMDPRMAAEVQKRVLGKPEQKKLEIILGDFVKADLPYFDVCISNTPYQISSPLVFKLLSHRPIIRTAVLMFQREFALRLVATPGSKSWCRLAANVQLYARVEHIMKVGKGNFRPPPQVESSVVRISPKNPPPAVRFEEFDGLNRIIFSRMHKTVKSTFTAKGVTGMLLKNDRTGRAERMDGVEEDDTAAAAPSSGPQAAAVEHKEELVAMKDKIDDILNNNGPSEDTPFAKMRAADMTVDDLLALLLAFNTAGIHFA